jgi:ABC-2 type transport system ATP-binding protein
VVDVMLVIGAKHGRHGLRIVVLVLLIAAVVGTILWVRARRRDRGAAHAIRHADSTPLEPKEFSSSSGGVGSTPRRKVGARGQPNAIEATNLTKRYGENLAVDDLTFEVRPGCVTGFLGPNGAGKSTTMRMIMGLDSPDGGSIAVNGRKYHELKSPLRQVGALLEARAIHPGRSAHAHLWMLARTNRIPRRRVDEVLELVGLTSVAQQRVGQFSLGMSQRLGIAVALLGDPGILMFDEPVNGLDTDGIRWVRQLLRTFASEGRAVFVSSHLMSEMAVTADHVVVIGKGRLIAQLPIGEFTAQNSNAYVRIRSPELARLRSVLEEAGGRTDPEPNGSLSVRGISREEVGRVAWQHSIMLHELATQSATLEEAFVESTEGSVPFSGSASQPAASPREGGR